jgi:hypothetical protein
MNQMKLDNVRTNGVIFLTYVPIDTSRVSIIVSCSQIWRIDVETDAGMTQKALDHRTVGHRHWLISIGTYIFHKRKPRYCPGRLRPTIVRQKGSLFEWRMDGVAVRNHSNPDWPAIHRCAIPVIETVPTMIIFFVR